jgi:hypothetical protein
LQGTPRLPCARVGRRRFAFAVPDSSDALRLQIASPARLCAVFERADAPPAAA